MMKFLNNRCHSLESSTPSQPSSQAAGSVRHQSNQQRSVTRYTHTSTGHLASHHAKYMCTFCKKPGHSIFRCTRFLALSPDDRVKQVETLNLCVNCLKSDHNVNACINTDSCRKCNAKHHTLIHRDVSKNIIVKPQSSTSANIPQSSVTVSHVSTNNGSLVFKNSKPQQTSYIILSTALVKLLDRNGSPVLCRALLDSASQINLMTESLAVQLGIKRSKCDLSVIGVGGSKTSSQTSVTISLQSRINNYSTDIDVFILPKITGCQPVSTINIESWPIPKNIPLADPQFHQPQQIDLLIGAEIFLSLLAIGQIRLADELPTLQNTLLGWIVSGKIEASNSNYFCNLAVMDNDQISDNIIERFWKLENSSNIQKLTAIEERCESHFKEHTKRDGQGKFIVKLPLKSSPTTLGDSRTTALRRYLNNEKKRNHNHQLQKSYVEFIQEYRRLGHMQFVSESEISENHYFLPHHCVLKPESSSTKLRVVFDGSAKTTTGKSLNDILMVGPVVQNELFSILLRFRAHKFVISADVSKMYRQIWIDETDSHLQCIFWRDTPQDDLCIYRLITVTYGTASAPYLATLCLQQLAIDARDIHQSASDAIRNDMYVDDLLTGSNSLSELQETKTQIISILGTAKMTLRKWCSNSPDILNEIPPEDREPFLQIGDDEYVKILGMYWQPQVDELHFRVTLIERTQITKRTVIADIARIYDPLGLTAPVITLGKVFLQQLWQLKRDWDESLPQALHTKWEQFRGQLLQLNQLTVERHLFKGSSSINVQLHGFADASERAYGAAIYTRCVDQNGEINVQLLCSKSRVAPLRKTTLPRLELCAAALLADLAHRVLAIINFEISKIFYWSDSIIVLHWLKSESSSWNTFVANRVASIQEMTNVNNWHHVKSEQNSADIVSRGMMPSDLLKSTLWFNGPQFLSTDDQHWIETKPLLDCSIPERRNEKSVLVAFKTESTTEYGNELIDSIKYKSNIRSLRNIMAWINRFIFNCRLHCRIQNKPDERKSGVLSTEEIENGLQSIIKIVQAGAFHDEIRMLKSKCLPTKNRLNSLSPFLDDKHILRVGGRLQKSSLPSSSKHPILLPFKHPFTLNLFCEYHSRLMHAGPQAMLSAIREKFWPLKGRRVASNIYRSCIRCFKLNPTSTTQLMGNLPAHRINYAPPFTIIGVDYCGPFYVHYKIRGKTATKAYLAIFICFSVKAVHLEVVSDMTTDAFLGALKRLIATRGMCRHIYSDNGTNFVGANSELQQMRNLFLSQQHQEEVTKYCQDNSITWHFQPPSSPHFGGLYEAAVKSSKHHLLRVASNASLTFEELNTVIKQVEAVLNSRPLTPMTSSPDDLNALTPGHFLIGRPLTAIIEPDITNDNISTIRRWRLVLQLQQHFWSRWSKEYLCELQHRRKWTTATKSLSVGELVLVKDVNLPPLQWKMGRVVEIHPGDDGLTRVATIKTSTGQLKRSISKLCPFPIYDDSLKDGILQGGEHV